MRTAVMNDIGLVPTRVVVVKETTILKTTSDKIQFRANRQALYIGDLNIIYEHDWSYEVGPTATKNMHDINTIGADEPFDTPYNRRALGASLEYQ